MAVPSAETRDHTRLGVVPHVTQGWSLGSHQLHAGRCRPSRPSAVTNQMRPVLVPRVTQGRFLGKHQPNADRCCVSRHSGTVHEQAPTTCGPLLYLTSLRDGPSAATRDHMQPVNCCPSSPSGTTSISVTQSIARTYIYRNRIPGLRFFSALRNGTISNICPKPIWILRKTCSYTLCH